MIQASEISRRLLMGGASAILTGCASAWPTIPAKPTQSPPERVTDVHTHLFNAADLPAAGFIKYTVLRPWADRGAARALVDLIVQVVKPLAMTVVEELHALETKSLREVDPETFARGASDRARGRPPSVARLAQRAPAKTTPRPETLDEGYNELGSILAAAYGDASLVARMAAARGRRDSPEFVEVFRRATTAADSSRAGQKAAVDRAVEALRVGPIAREAAVSGDSDFIGAIVRTFAWVVVMLQPRSSHLQRYIKTYSHDGLRPVRVVNLLVDMGAWLHGEEDRNMDGPEPGASIAHQVDFWSQAAKHYEGSVEVLTFAPYCPLQHAYDRRDQTQGGKYLQQLEGWYASGAIAGCKLYPPMGYYPTGNRGKGDEAYTGDDGIRKGVVNAWNSGGSPGTLGNALQDALDAFYAACRTRNIPIIAHSGPSNTPAEKFLDRPNPAHWAPVAAMGVRLMLGHFAFRADLFVKEMTTSAPKTVWAITSAAPLIKAHHNVWIDISYVNEVLGEDAASRKLADDFYEQLRRYCVDPASPTGGCDPEFDQIVYGSDWIMLHREADHRRYLQIARDHMTAARGWPADAFEKIASKNADRFLLRTT